MTTKEKVTHTPGPWEWEHIPATPETIAVSTLRGPLVLCRYWHGLTELPDAALIAAAPEMGAELYRALAVIRNPQAFDKDGVCDDITIVLQKAGLL